MHVLMLPYAESGRHQRLLVYFLKSITLALCFIFINLFFYQGVQNFADEHLKTSLGEPVKGKKNKTSTELWLEKFYKKTTNLPEPFPHELVERLEKYLDVTFFPV